MVEVIVIFSLAATGCLVRLSTDLVLQLFARRMPNGTIATGPHHGQSPESRPHADPVVTFGLTLTIYGAISLVLVSELPGILANERTCLAFALLCVGGLIGEISRTRARVAEDDGDDDESGVKDSHSNSIGLSVALMLTLNLAVALLCSGQGLVPIVPPAAPVSNGQAPELEQIVVIGRRGADDGTSANLL